MARFHISQDETGYYQLTFENDEGELVLVSHQFENSKQLIEDAVEMAESGDYGSATVVVDPARRAQPETLGEREYRRPAPRKADA